MDEMAHKLLSNRVDQLYFRIIEVDATQRGDLMRMWHHARAIWMQVDLEEINCRRLGKETVRKQELMAKLEESLTTVEQYLTWANLLN